MEWHRPLRLLAALTAATAMCPATAAAAAPAYAHYVALGDSYTSGPLIPLQRLDPLGCGRSTLNYPSLLARELRVATFTDVSCAGAQTGHMRAPQDVSLGRNAPQFTALRADTDLVTIGLGGNDDQVFRQVIDTCPGLRSADPTGNPCERHFTVDGVDTIASTITRTRVSLLDVLRGIRERAPMATVLAVGYPRILPATGYCPEILPFADGDYAWLTRVEQELDAALAGAAADAGVSYVDTFGPSLGHDACAPAGAAWINGKDLDPLAAADYHPFRSGMEGVASVVRGHLARSSAMD
jgi:lysophospholipase L1-like esterase